MLDRFGSPQGVKKTGRGTCEGKILSQEKGGGGFGYDPLFVKHEYSKSFAELEESVKNRISHRRKAFDKILPSIESLIEVERMYFLIDGYNLLFRLHRIEKISPVSTPNDYPLPAKRV